MQGDQPLSVEFNFSLSLKGGGGGGGGGGGVVEEWAVGGLPI